MEESKGSPQAEAAFPLSRRWLLPTESGHRGRTQSDISSFCALRKSHLLHANLTGSGKRRGSRCLLCARRELPQPRLQPALSCLELLPEKQKLAGEAFSC